MRANSTLIIALTAHTMTLDSFLIIQVVPSAHMQSNALNSINNCAPFLSWCSQEAPLVLDLSALDACYECNLQFAKIQSISALLQCI